MPTSHIIKLAFLLHCMTCTYEFTISKSNNITQMQHSRNIVLKGAIQLNVPSRCRCGLRASVPFGVCKIDVIFWKNLMNYDTEKVLVSTELSVSEGVQGFFKPHFFIKML